MSMECYVCGIVTVIFTCKCVRPDSRARANGSSRSVGMPEDELSVAIHPERVKKWDLETTQTGETTTWPSARTSRFHFWNYQKKKKKKEERD